MDSTINEYRVSRHLLIWPVAIPSNVQALFTVVFMDIMGLIRYVSMVFSRTEKFYLTIHLDCFEDLKNDSTIYKFPSVVRIDVICDSFRDVELAKHRFPNEPQKVQFRTIYDLLELLGKVELDTALVSSNLIDRSTISVIISLIEARISAKRSDMSVSHAHIQKESASTTLNGFPVRNIDDFIPCYVCPSCKLVYQQAYLLECKHQQCGICANIQKSCSTCFKDVSRDKIMVNQNLQIQMQDIPTHCSNCDWKQPLKNYEVHFKQNHYELISHFIYTQQLDERISHPQYLTEDQAAYISNSSASDSDTTGTSLNSTYIWHISDVRDIKNYAAFNEQKSIYSTPFYLSPYGYKMCLQLFLNRDDRTRSTHISVGLLIKQGVHDENLRWPFEYKVTFTLVNQLQPNNSQSQSFWTDPTSICFRRPIADMNLPFGISKWFSLDVCEEIEEHFIHNNTMFVKVTVDFLAKKPEIPYKNNASELMSNTEQDGVTDDGIFAKICLSDNSNSNQRSN